jgi:hypothetical protein
MFHNFVVATYLEKKSEVVYMQFGWFVVDKFGKRETTKFWSEWDDDCFNAW